MEERRKNEELRLLLDTKSKVDSLWRHHTEDRLDQRVRDLEHFQSVLTERLDDEGEFNENQVRRIKEIFYEIFDKRFDERTDIHAGRAFLRWLGAVALGATSAALAYIGLKR